MNIRLKNNKDIAIQLKKIEFESYLDHRQYEINETYILVNLIMLYERKLR